MNEFEEKDFGEARSLADAIKGNAENIMNIFDDIDNTMKSLYGQNWESAGSENAHSRYMQIRSNYEGFYNSVVNMRTHVYNVTALNEAADKAASNAIAGV